MAAVQGNRRSLAMQRLALVLGFAFAVGGCGGDSVSPPGGLGDTLADAPDGANLDLPSDNGVTLPELPRGVDTDAFDAGPRDADGDGAPKPGQFGAACRENSDCAGGYCVPTGDGFVCTRTCVDECPAGWLCKAVLSTYPDLTFICVPEVHRLCEPCNTSYDCAAAGDLCMALGTGTGAGQFCLTDCSIHADCEPGFTCAEILDDVTGEPIARQCLPDTGSCICRPGVDGTRRPCSNANEWGTCLGEERCAGPAGWVECSAATPTIETCDGADNDCDGTRDEGFAYPDWDGAVRAVGDPCGTGLCAGGRVVCVSPTTAACSSDGQRLDEDCNNLDDDCDGNVDEGVLTTFYRDGDEDGHGTAEATTLACAPPPGFVALADDCDDANPAIAGGLTETCDALDNDCDGQTDEDFAFTDVDGATLAIGAVCGSGSCAGGTVVCADLTRTTCSSLGSASSEICDDFDEDCDGLPDNGCDDDGDGYCDADYEVVESPAICEATGADCNDTDDEVFPGADERCNRVDDDCDGDTDDAVVDCPSFSCTGSGNDYYETGVASCVDGACYSPDALGCGNYTCAGGGASGDACATVCTGDDTCIEAAHCVEAEARCLPDLPDGAACAEASDCASEHCQNGFCCLAGDCCGQPADCPAEYVAAPICDDPATCQGTRREAVCAAAVCETSPPIEDDSACGRDVMAQDCAPYQPVYCTGALHQVAPVCGAACDGEGDCQPGYHCDDTCQPDVPDGLPCDEASDCVSDHCQNGFCCAAGDCCGQAGDCPASYRLQPACDDAATCQGHRVDPTCETARCGSTAALPDDSGCTSAVTASECGFYVAIRCTGAADQLAPECPAVCTVDSECDPAAHCDGVCLADVPDGGPCDEGSDCQAGHCQNGFCCLTGDCCNFPTDCPPSYSQAPTCLFPTTCQGTVDAASCTGNVCGTEAGVANDSACTSTVLARDCGPYPDLYCTGQTSQPEPQCATSCAVDSDCDANAHCDGNRCLVDVANGGACDEASDCVSGHCQNGFCCASGDCCASAGDCSASVYGQPPTCTDVAHCQGSRRSPVCSDNRCTEGPITDDDSACGGQVANLCGPYPAVVCTSAVSQDPPTCASSCATDNDCDASAHCEGNRCVDDVGVGSPCSRPSDCQAGLYCADGVCCTSACADGPCRRCDLAGSLGTCANVAVGADPDSECGAIDCSAYYWGWNGDTCYDRANVGAASVGCNGGGACQTAADLCPSQGAGDSRVTCHATCQDPTGGTCAGATAGSCTNVNPGSHSCGVGACARTVAQCINGAPNPCVPGPPTNEVCNAQDDDCDGATDAADGDLLTYDRRNCENQQGVCSGCTKPASLCQSGSWASCGTTQYQACSGYYQAGVETSCDGRDNDCDGRVDDDFGSDINNCGSCGNQCTNAHGSTQCVNGTCQPTCVGLWRSCNSDPDDGCETAVNTLQNCGNCGVTCALPNASETCETGSCLVSACDYGYCNSNGSAGDGCEFDLDVEPACTTYVNLGSVRGDQGADTVSHAGYGEKWLRVFVSEADSGLSCVYLSATVVLTPPQGTDYDLTVYCDNCTTVAGSSSAGGSAVDTVQVRWDEAASVSWPVCVPSGSGSGRYLYVKVRYFSANVCSNFNLAVYGNTDVSSNTCSEL